MMVHQSVFSENVTGFDYILRG